MRNHISSLETPWVEEMIKKYHALASKTGAIVSSSMELIFQTEEQSLILHTDHPNNRTCSIRCRCISCS